VEFETGSDQYFVCDMGSGARPFGAHVLARQSGRPATVNIFMSHMHWDHIMGFPFFGPAYVAGTKLRFYGCHDDLEHALRRQQEPPSFPVPFSQLSASIEFVQLVPNQTREVSGVRVTAAPQFHSGESFGFRFEREGKSFVYSTDSEHKLEDIRETQRIVAFFRGADLVIFDAMYSLADAVSVKEDWGHSSNVVGVELCQMAAVKKLALFHHEPANDDAAIERILKDARRLEELTRQALRLEVIAAYDGLEMDL
jgi:phosphoribosyl 1,2-cyclic phosphodiesterase